MASVFLGINDRTFTYESTAARAEHVGAGVRYPMDFALTTEDIAYIINRGREDRPDGTRLTIMKLGEGGEEYISTFGSYGEEPGQFIWPAGIALDRNTNVYVTDEWLHRVTKYNKDGEYVTHWGTQGSGDGELNRPSGIAINREDTLYIVDSRNDRLQKFSLDGKFESSFGESGDKAGQFNMPWGIGLDNDGNIYVTDWRNDRIQQFNSDGEWQATFGTSGTAVGQFNRPNSVSVDTDGDIYVSDWLNDRIQILAPDGRFITQLTGDHVLSQWGRDKMSSNPDMIRQRQLAITHSADFDKNFSHPTAVKVNSEGQVVILDSTRGRLQVYTKNSEPVLI